DHHHSGEFVLLAEFLDVVHHLLGELHLGPAALHVWSVKSFDVVLTENGFPRPDLFDFGANLIEERCFEDAGFDGACIAIVFVNVPATEAKVIQARERHEILDSRDSLLGAFSETDRTELRQRANRLGNLFFDGFDTRNKRGADSAKPGNKNAEL